MISALLALHEALSQSLERWTVYGLACAGGPSCHLRGPFGRRPNRITIVHHASEFGLLVMHCGGASLRNCAVDGCSVPWRAIDCRCVSSDCGRHSRVSGPQSWLLFVALGIQPPATARDPRPETQKRTAIEPPAPAQPLGSRAWPVGIPGSEASHHDIACN